MTRYDKLPRPVTLLVAAMIGALALAVTVHVSAVGVTPNAAIVSYNLAAGANSAPITPAASQATYVMGVCNTLGFRGVGSVTMLRVPANFLEWEGIESPSGSAITSGFSGSAGTHIVYLDFSHQVDIRVNTADTFVIHNGAGSTRTGNVTLIF